jgi:hypothetical protein
MEAVMKKWIFILIVLLAIFAIIISLAGKVPMVDYVIGTVVCHTFMLVDWVKGLL